MNIIKSHSRFYGFYKTKLTEVSNCVLARKVVIFKKSVISYPEHQELLFGENCSGVCHLTGIGEQPCLKQTAKQL